MARKGHKIAARLENGLRHRVGALGATADSTRLEQSESALEQKPLLGRNPDIPRWRVRSPIHASWSLRDVLIDQQDRLFLLVPVLFGTGAALWLAAPREPQIWALLSLLVVASAIAFRIRPSITGVAVATSIALLAAGALWIGFQAARGGGPAVVERTGPLNVRATIARMEHRPGDQLRLTLRDITIAQALPEAVPRKLRITLRPSQHRGVVVGPGARIQIRAILMPLPDAAMPGGYDFSRRAFFEGLGGLGFALSSPRLLSEPDENASVIEALQARIDQLRLDIRGRIHASLSGAEAAVAAALIVGQRADIPDHVRETLRVAGLAHILAISGLHMALLAGGVFFAVRAGLALMPPIALRVSTRKLAALAGLAAALLYLFLSGATVATQRAFVMAAIVFAAMLLDRPALTLRAVALAALVVLVIDPKAAAQAGFQMSFAATAALVAVYEVLRRRREQFNGGSTLWRSAWLWPVRLAAGLAVTSLVAGAATGPIAAFHFNHMASFGLIGNVVAMPILTFATMPLGALALMLMPFGLEPVALYPMGQSIAAIIGVSEWVQSLPRSDLIIAAMPEAVLPLILLSGCWLIIWTHPVRYAGLAGFAIAAVLVATARAPDMLISRDGRMAAIASVEENDVTLNAIATSRSAFTLENWLRRIGDKRPETHQALKNIRCGEGACAVDAVTRVPQWPISVAIERYGDDIGALCAEHDIVVLPSQSPRGNPIPVQAGRNRAAAACKDRLVIARSTLLERGALAIWAEPVSQAGSEGGQGTISWTWRIRGARDHSRQRQWSTLNREPLRFEEPDTPSAPRRSQH
jgi:competence protein ComEC